MSVKGMGKSLTKIMNTSYFLNDKVIGGGGGGMNVNTFSAIDNNDCFLKVSVDDYIYRNHDKSFLIIINWCDNGREQFYRY